jgi:hypothetical protein
VRDFCVYSFYGFRLDFAIDRTENANRSLRPGMRDAIFLTLLSDIAGDGWVWSRLLQVRGLSRDFCGTTVHDERIWRYLLFSYAKSA